MQEQIHQQIHSELQLLLKEDIQSTEETMRRMLEHRGEQLQLKLDAALKKVLLHGSPMPEASVQGHAEGIPVHHDVAHEDRDNPVSANFSDMQFRLKDDRLTNQPQSASSVVPCMPSETPSNFIFPSTTSEQNPIVETEHFKAPSPATNDSLLWLRAVATYFNIDPTRTHQVLLKKRLPFPIHNAATKIVHDHRFTLFISGAILVNAYFTAVSTDWAMRMAVQNWEGLAPLQYRQGTTLPPLWMRMVDLLFSIIFLVELLLRIFSEEILFLCGHNVKWNIFDIILVSTAWSDVAIDNLGTTVGGNYSFMRVLRVLRVMRGFRIIRVMHMFQELRVVLLSLMGSIVPLFWALFCVFVVIFLFNIIFMQGLAQYVSEQPGGADVIQKHVIPHFGTFGATFKTLLMAISGGQDWYIFYDTMSGVSTVFAALFITYICLMTFGTLNVITAIMVETATTKARRDFEVCKAEEQYRTEASSRQLVRLFTELQPDMSGTITRRQWERICTSPNVISYFHMLGIDIKKAQEVWRLLDLDNSNELDLEEFVSGCLHIQGGASVVDVEALMRATRTLMRKTVKSIADIHKEFEKENKNQTSMVLQILDRLVQNDAAAAQLASASKVVV